MLERKSLRLPITLGVLMILVIVLLIVGWVLITVFSARSTEQSQFYWVLLTIGTLLFLFVLVGVIMYLVLSIKAINLNRRQSNFIDSVTHELKSPIASLKLYLQTLTIRQVSETEREKFYEYMLGDVERLDSLISHLLDAGRVENRRSDADCEAVNLSLVIQDCVNTVATRHQISADVFQLELAEAYVWAPPVDINIIYRNLIDNAVKYANSPPRVLISMKITDQQVLTEIMDNGPGIPTSQSRKIFGRFQRLGSELQRKKPGTGLGLYIVRTLVKQAGGTVALLTNGRLGGARFEVRFPRHVPGDSS
jgi:two-component system phosphate regulon sensor histidine kinase PhoR